MPSLTTAAPQSRPDQPKESPERLSEILDTGQIPKSTIASAADESPMRRARRDPFGNSGIGASRKETNRPRDEIHAGYYEDQGTDDRGVK